MGKATIIIFLIISALLILYWIGKKSVHSEIIIEATPKQVWEVLLDTDKYSDWNPTMELLAGELKVGNTVRYKYIQSENNQSEIPARVKKIVAEKLLNQGGGLPFILTYDHSYSLSSVENNTKVVIHEDYEGIYVPFWNPQPVQMAYERLNKALKNRVETLIYE